MISPTQNFPKPGGTAALPGGTTLWWKYTENRLIVEFRGDRGQASEENPRGVATYDGFDATGSYLTAGFDNASGSFDVYKWVNGKLSLFQSYQRAPGGYPTPPPGLNAQGATQPGSPEWCDEVPPMCGEATLGLDTDQNYVLSYGSDLVRPPRKVNVCLLTLKITVTNKAPAFFQATEKIGPKPTATPFDGYTSSDSIFLFGNKLDRNARAFRISGKRLIWVTLTAANVSRTEISGMIEEPRCEAKWHP